MRSKRSCISSNDPRVSGIVALHVDRRERDRSLSHRRLKRPLPVMVITLEPVSKSFEEDNEAGKLDKAEEIVGVILPTNEDPALPLNPGEEALDEPASHVAA